MPHAAPLGPIDCDLHPVVPGIKTLLPYLDDLWREAVVRRGIEDLTTISYPTRNPLSFRQDWRDASGRTALDVASLTKQALDPLATQLAILTPLYGTQAVFSEDLGVAMTRALNDWIAKEWLDRDPRLRASIILPQQNAEMAVEEIERLAHDKRFVQVMLLAGSETNLGRRSNWPIYAAAERHGLPVGIHAGSMFRNPVTAVGWPTTYTEEYVNQAGAFQTQLTSLIAEGVFARFPNLTVVLMESGVTWLPAYFWRLTKFWKGTRSEIPWVADSPTSIIRDRVRMTLQPFDAPPDAASVMRVIEHIGSDKMILFSTDYPHWQYDGESPLPEGLDPALAAKIMVENPLSTYVRLKERETAA